MTIFKNDLTLEEENAGFTTNETDNDTFYIEKLEGKYFGDVPDYDTNTLINSMIENKIEFDLSEDIENKIEVEDNYQEITNIEENDNNIIEDKKIDDNFENIDNNVENVEQNDIDAKTEQSVYAENETQNENDEKTLGIENIEKPIVFDDDFLNLLKNDIAKPIVKSNIIEQEKQAIKDVIQIGDSLKVDTTQGEEEFIADLLSMEMETKINEKKQSKDFLGNSQSIENENIAEDFLGNPQSIENENIAEDFLGNPQSIENENNTNKNKINADNNNNIDSIHMTEEEKKQNNKKTFALIIAIVIVAMILIIGGVIGYLYLSSKQNIPVEPKVTDTLLQAEKTTKQNELKDTIITDIDEIDTNKVEVKEDKVKLDTNSNAQQTIAPKSVVTKSITSSPSQSKNLNKEIKTTDVPKIEEQGALYTIQVYSSPDKSDAEKRLSMLNKRGITGYISQQDIKGQIWYRVRFGNFENYEDAKSMVKKLALKDVWIERIR